MVHKRSPFLEVPGMTSGKGGKRQDEQKGWSENKGNCG